MAATFGIRGPEEMHVLLGCRDQRDDTTFTTQSTKDSGR
jgi:hypothetical protein